MSKLLELPTELRLDILERVFGWGFVKIGEDREWQPSIAHVNRQLHDETLEVLYRRKVL